MRGAQTSRGVTAAALMGLAASAPAHALEIEQVLGRWSSTIEDCQYPDNSEAAPLHIRREGGEIWIGNYGWLCSVPAGDWKKDGDFLVAEAKACGQEGDEETFDETLVLGLNARDELLMAKDQTDGLLRCPAAQ